MKDYDIIHTHNTPCQLLTAIASCGNKVKLITTEHSTQNNRLKWKWYRFIDRWMYSRYSYIICVNKEVENIKKREFHDEISNKIMTVNNGIDTDIFIKAKPIKEIFEQYFDVKLIIMVAAFRPEKDQKTLIKSIRHLPENYHLLLAGDGECIIECKKLVSKLLLDSRVHFLGIRNDIPSLLKTADVVVMSSNYEGLSLSAIEGMASGKPVIASDVNGLRNIVNDAGLLFSLGDSIELAHTIRNVCEDNSLYQKISERCLKRAMQYDISKTVNGYANIYTLED